MKRPDDLQGLVALVLAAGVTGTLLVFAVGSTIRGGRILTPEEIGALTTVGGAAIGAVAVYLGTSKPNGGHMIERPPERDEPVEPEPTSEPDADPTDEEADEITQGMGPGDEDETDG